MQQHFNKHPRLREGIGRGFLLSLFTAMSTLTLLEGQMMGVDATRINVQSFIEQLKASFVEVFAPLNEEGSIKRLLAQRNSVNVSNRKDNLKILSEVSCPDIDKPNTQEQSLALWLRNLQRHIVEQRWNTTNVQVRTHLRDVQQKPYSVQHLLVFVSSLIPQEQEVSRWHLLEFFSKSLCIRGPNSSVVLTER